MGGIVSKNAFLPPIPSPIQHTDDLKMITTKKNHIIPVLFISSPEAKYTLFFSHGNAEDLGDCENWFYYVRDILKVNVVIYDYPGYGLSSSKGEKSITPCESFCYEAVSSVYDYVTNERNISPNSIIAFGRSLGTGPTCEIASRKTFGGVILQSPLLSAVRVVFNTPFNLPVDIFINQDKINKISVPIFIMHGYEDRVISIDHGKKLFNMIDNKYKYQPWWIESAGHNDIESRFQKEYFEKISEFIESLTQNQR